MNARRVPLEAPKERSRVCFGGFRPLKQVEEARLRAGTPHFGVQARWGGEFFTVDFENVRDKFSHFMR